jgi:hypothetical protein
MKTLAILKYGFALIGAGLLAGGLYWAQNVRAFIAGAARAEGTVIELVSSYSSGSTTWRPVVRFAAEGKTVEFVSSSSSNPPSYSKGEKVTVLYSPGAPHDAKIEGFFSLWLGPIILGGIGSVFFAIGGAMIVVTRSRAALAQRLRSQGMTVQAKFQGVELNTGLTVNGAHPYRLVAQWQGPTGEIHVFRSEDLWYDPSDHVKRETLTVYIDPADPRKHYVDVSFLPRLAS